MLLLTTPTFQLHTTGRLIKAHERQLLAEVDTLLTVAKAEVARYYDSVAEEFARAQREGYAMGEAMAAERYATALTEWVQAQAEIEKRLGERLTQTVLIALKHYFSMISEETLIAAFVRRAWEEVGRNQTQLILKVAPTAVAICREKARTWLEMFPLLERIDVQEAADLTPDQCVVISPIGRMTLSLQAQLDALSNAFTNAFQK